MKEIIYKVSIHLLISMLLTQIECLAFHVVGQTTNTDRFFQLEVFWKCSKTNNITGWRGSNPWSVTKSALLRIFYLNIFKISSPLSQLV